MAMSYVWYIGVLVACWLLARFADQYNSKKCVWGIVAILSLFAGLRAYSVGIDTDNYVALFKIIENGDFKYAYGLEESFKYICYIFLKIIPSNSALLTFLALITNGLTVWRFWDFRRVSAFPTMVAAYYMGFFFISLNGMRQFCAIAILLYFTRYLNRNQNLKYLGGVLLATLFHTSGWIGLAFYGINLLRWKKLGIKGKLFYIGIVALSPALIAFLLLQMIRYTGYFDDGGDGVGLMVPIKIALFCASLLFIYLLYGRKNHFGDPDIWTDSEKSGLMLATLAYGAGLALIFMSYFIPVLNRVGWYFTAYEGIYMGSLLRTKHKLHRFIFGICVIVVLGYGFVAAMTGNDQGTMPYLFVWQQ